MDMTRAAFATVFGELAPWEEQTTVPGFAYRRHCSPVRFE
jgi:hypothetical protein